MVLTSNRRRPPVRVEQVKDDTIQNTKDLSFSYTADRSYKNFGFGTSGLNSQNFVTTEDVRLALDKAFRNKNSSDLRILSRHFFKVSGVYSRAASYLAYLPTYDYLVTPRVTKNSIGEEKIIREVVTQLMYLEKAKLKQTLASISLDVIVDGVSYVYWRRKGRHSVIQKLPTAWCRTVSSVNGFPTVEFNLEYFDSFTTQDRLLRELSTFPPEVIYEYNLWKKDGKTGSNTSQNRQNRTILGSSGTWVLLNPDKSTAFYFNPNLQPLLANSFFAILDVMELKGIEKKKAENELYNLVVQQFDFDGDGEPMVELPDMQAFHNSAKTIFENTNQTDLLTTLADVKNINLNEAAAAPINFDPWNKSIYGELGVSSQLFSTEGNMALEKSILIDEALVRQLVEKYEDWINSILELEFFNESDGFSTSIFFPPITINNRMDISQKYKDMATLGYSKMLPALALGQSQLDIMSIPAFENDILDLAQIMKPLQSSHTASSKGAGGTGGRPPLPDSEKSDKTIANQN